MEINVRETEDVKVVNLQGDLDTNTAAQCEAKLKEIIDGNVTKILLNLEELDFMSSAGLRVSLATAKRLQGLGGSLRVCCLNETVQEIFEMSGFISILKVSATEQESINAFSAE